MRGLISLSASREKKQRQGGSPADKALAAKQQADQARRKTIQYTVIGVVVAVLVAALLIWNSGFFQARATAVKVGGTNYTAAQTSYFYHSSYAYRVAAAYGQMMGYDTSKSPKDQPYGEDGRTYHDYFLESAMEDMASVTARYDAAIKNGVTAADVKEELDSNIEAVKQYASQYGVSYSQYLKGSYGSYMTPSVFKDCLTRNLVADKYQDDHRSGLDYTTEQLRAYYDEHKDDLDSFKYSYLYFVPDAVETKDADGNDIEMTDEEKTAKEEQNLADAKAKAEGAKAALKSGKSVDDVITNSEPTSYGKDEENEGKSVSGAYAEWLKDASRKPGDVELVENGASGFYVAVFGERFLDETPTVDTRHILVSAEISDGASAPTDEQMADAKAKAEDLLSQWKAGAATEDSFAELANANSTDSGSNTNGGLYEGVYKGQFVANYNEWLFDSARQPGDTGVVENNGTSYYGYHVVYYVKENPGHFRWMVEAKDTLSSEDTSTWLEELRSGYTPEQADGTKYLAQ